MKEILKRGATSNILRVFLQDSASTTGAGKTGLTTASGGLTIATIADNEASPVFYAGANLETITAIGTYQTPTAGKCRFQEVSATYFPGVYEIHIADGRFAVANSTQLLVSIQATGVAPVFVEYQLVAYDPYNATSLGLTNLDAQVSTRLSSTGSISSLTGNLTGTVGGVNGNVTGSVNSVTTGVTVTTNNDKSSYSLSASQTFSTTGSVGSVSGNVSGNVTGSVGSVTGNVSGNVVGSVGSIGAGGISSSSITANAIADDVWNALVTRYTTNTTLGYRILRSDATSHSGDVQVSGNGSANNHNRIDADVHAISSDTTAATNLKNALTGIAGTTITATLTALDVNERIAIADALLARDIGSGTNAGTVNERTVRSALRALRNKSSISGSLLTVTKENDDTLNPAWTATVSSDAAAIPVTGIDPV